MNQRQQELASDKVADLANLAAAALVFGQAAVGASFTTATVMLGAVGILLWGALAVLSLVLSRGARR